VEFDELYDDSHRPVLRAVLMLVDDVETAADITAEAFTRGLSRWDKVSQLDNPGGWVRHVAVNLAIDHSRTARRRTSAMRHLITGMRRSSPAPTSDSVDIVRALERLSPAQRQAIVLHHLLDMSVAEIAVHTQRPVSSVKTSLHRGRAALAQILRIDNEVPADV
jgi:RNA polymerase sigma-70 factor (ECF subfamily)